MVKPINIFISYAHADAPLLAEFEKFLAPYERNKTITVWTDRDITPGQTWDSWIKLKLRQSEIILFLVSQDFLASNYINDVEIKEAIDNSRVINIPVIVRPVLMSQLVLNYLQVVPSGAKPVIKWEPPDEGWIDIIKALEKVFAQINGNAQSLTARAYSTDKIVMGLIITLLVISLGVFVYGLFKMSQFHIFTSFVGMGIGLVGYFLGRKMK